MGNMRLHFDFEQKRYCEVPSYNCVDHMMKHYRFWYLRTRRRLSAARRSTGRRTGWLSTSRTRITSTRRDCLDLTPETSSLVSQPPLDWLTVPEGDPELEL